MVAEVPKKNHGGDRHTFGRRGRMDFKSKIRHSTIRKARLSPAGPFAWLPRLRAIKRLGCEFYLFSLCSRRRR